MDALSDITKDGVSAFTAGGGSADGIGALPTLWVSGIANRPGWGIGTSVGALSADTLYVVPFEINRAGTATRIGINVTTAAASGGLCRLGIYSIGANGLPGVLLLDAGTVNTTSTGIKEIVISQALAVGSYWIAMLPNLAVNVRSVTNTAVPAYQDTLGNLGSSFSRAFAFASLPSDESSATYTFRGGFTSPIPHLRAA